MATGTFHFPLPEDGGSDQLRILSAQTKNGTYTEVTTVPYTYGATAYKFTNLDTGRWYKVQFLNSVTLEASLLSDPIYGGDINQSKAFLTLSTGTDGANFASIQDVYDYAGLSSEQVTPDRVSIALRSARAFIDVKVADLDIDRFQNSFKNDTARRKFNAVLRLLKEAELNLALSNIYRHLSDDSAMNELAEDIDLTSLGLGDSSVNLEGNAGAKTAYEVLMGMSDRYARRADDIIKMIQPGTISISATDASVVRKGRRFKHPSNRYH